jgi:hypothetical protein
MKLPTFSFTKWLAGKQAVSFALAIGVIFLITNYQNILHITNPENKDYFNYPFALRVFLSHIDSLFFGLATAIFIFQSKSEWQKILYCIFEAIMVGLNLNRGYMGVDALFWLSCYIAVFSGFTLYFLGTLAKQHNTGEAHEAETGKANEAQTDLLQRIESLVFGQEKPSPTAHSGLVDEKGNPIQGGVFAEHNEPAPIGFVVNGNIPKTGGKGGRPALTPEKVTEIQTYLQNGYSMRKTAEACKVSLNSVVEAKKQAKML